MNNFYVIILGHFGEWVGRARYFAAVFQTKVGLLSHTSISAYKCLYSRDPKFLYHRKQNFVIFSPSTLYNFSYRIIYIYKRAHISCGVGCLTSLMGEESRTQDSMIPPCPPTSPPPSLNSLSNAPL